MNGRRRDRGAWGVAAAAAAGLLLGACSAPLEEPPDVPPSPQPTEERTHPPEPAPVPEPALGSFAVSAGHPEAVRVGMEVLEDGGTAVDAAIAAAFAVSVVEMFASGIGGGGSAIVVPPGQDPVAYDYREVVPASGAVPASNSGVPGFVAGMDALHAEYGTLDWERLLQPAVALAREGHPASEMVADQLRSTLGTAAASGLGHLFPGGSPLGAGDQVVQEDLAVTLETLATAGPGSFYDGELAQSLAANVSGMDAPSLTSYEVQVSDPPRGAFGDYDVVSAAPALPGAALIQMLQIAEALGVAASDPGSPDYVDQLSAAWGQAAGTVEAELGDPDFVDVPLAEITDRERNAALAEALGSGASASSAQVSTSDSETTHLTIVDADGFMVSMTNTLTNFWGSGQYLDGYFLNNQLIRFSVGAGGQNTPEAGRRSVSWGLPTVVLDDAGRPVLGIGSPGGQRIPMIMGDVLTRWALHGQPLEEAVAAGRFYGAAGEAQFEHLPPDGVAAELRSRGWSVTGPVPAHFYVFGSVQSLQVDWESGEISGAVDTRREAALDVRLSADTAGEGSG